MPLDTPRPPAQDPCGHLSPTSCAGPLRRRTLLAHLLGGALVLAGGGVTGCGGGGEDADPGAGSGTDPGPSGTLVYRNSSETAVVPLAGGTAIGFDPGDHPMVDPGMATSPDGLLLAAQDGDNDGFGFAVFDRGGRLQRVLRFERPFAFVTHHLSFHRGGARLAFSVDEPRSAADDERIARTLLVSWPEARVLGTLDGWEAPTWAGDELIVRDPATGRLRGFDAAGADLGWIGDIVTDPQIAAYDVSADGRHVVWQDGSRILAYERSTGARSVAATREISDLSSPCLSPDGRWLALMTLDQRSATSVFWTTVPHVLPFVPDGAIEVDSARWALDGPIAECRAGIGWLP
ncbi:hypothetical protein [Rubrivivax gelatinosus]|uniref:hypothetical protein n=1 Tax=Rubrivivax gelatinosus TaxID=28068 RepID=UPI0019054DB3|nr:hypothetical protein [Rubrivivax gelatinosus]